MSITIETRNYRALRNTHWTPSGVCVLVGPNGAGKTTLLTLFEFFRNAYLRSASSAIENIGGVYGLRSWGAAEDEPILVAFSAAGLRWELQLTAHGPTLADQLGEKLTHGSEEVLSRPALAQHFFYKGERRQLDDREERLGLRVAADAERADELRPLAAALVSNRIYRNYHLWGLRNNGSRQSGDLFLHPNGQNVFAVLRNWRDRRDFKPQYEFVVSALRHAFPDLFYDFDFHVAGMTITADLIEPTGNETCPLSLAPSGWLTALLHLSAVAGTAAGAFVALDDFGNDLHPFAIRSLTNSFREWADEYDLTVCLASHSPVLLDEFKDCPSSVFVMERALDNGPVPLTELFDSDWLARFSLGKLYQHGEFAGQTAGRGGKKQSANGAT